MSRGDFAAYMTKPSLPASWSSTNTGLRKLTCDEPRALAGTVKPAPAASAARAMPQGRARRGPRIKSSASETGETAGDPAGLVVLPLAARVVGLAAAVLREAAPRCAVRCDRGADEVVAHHLVVEGRRVRDVGAARPLQIAGSLHAVAEEQWVDGLVQLPAEEDGAGVRAKPLQHIATGREIAVPGALPVPVTEVGERDVA